MAILAANEVSVAYQGKQGRVQALERVSLTLRSQEIVVALGASGCGKSTLLNLFAGFQKPTSGEVLLNGHPITGPGADRAVVFQDDALMPWLSAEDNVAFGLQMGGKTKSERLQKARDLLASVGLETFSRHMVQELSGGMRQRVGLARALAVNPDFLLMDEPLGALDELNRQSAQSLILNLWKGSGNGIFLITHSVEEALFLATELVLMSPRPGRIVRRVRPGFSSRFLGGEPIRAVRSDPDFVALREDMLAAILEHGEVADGQE